MSSGCPKCKSTEVSLLKQCTTLGYQRFRCKVCRGTFNERSGTVYLGGDVLHRTNQYLNNLIEQDHRGIKQRYGPMKGFKSFESASRFCRAYDELRNYYKASKRGEKVSLKQQRASYLNKTLELTWSIRLSS